MAGRPLLSRSSGYQQGRGLEYVYVTRYTNVNTTTYLPQDKLLSRKIQIEMLVETSLAQVVL